METGPMNKRPASSILSGVIMTLALLVFGSIVSQPVAAQSPRIVHEVIKDTKPRQSMGRDLWFALATNYENQGGKYYQLYVASPAKTTVNVAIGKATSQKFLINPLQVLVFDVPLSWELRGSGVPEEKAIHVWSEDADLTAYLLSRNPATSDGMYIIPSIGWGTEYVVASFASYAYYSGYEYPSEMVIIANQDNTVVTITPTTDLRQGISSAVAYPRNKPFSVTLKKGEAVQYMASAANGDMENYNLTGTVITSTKPVGVVGAVQCANIPAEDPWCDHICDMLPPTRTWATTYYSAPYINRKGGDGFLVVAKEDNTTITRTSSSGARTHAVLNKFEHYMRHDIDEASKWSSDKPFMLVQYCNSTSYGGGNDGIGDPNMTVVNPVEQYAPFVLFQTPKISAAQIQFRNYVNIIVHKNAINSTLFDGNRINFGRLDIPGTDYVVYRAQDIKPGSHTVESDSGVGVYIYGYGSYDSYAWTGAFGTRTFDSPDTVAPDVTIQTQCFTSHIAATDKGTGASKLNAIDLDTIYNFTFEIDPNWQAGTGKESAFYDIEVIDQSKPAFASVVIYDAAGNTATINSRYTPQIATISPDLTDFGIVTGTVPQQKQVTITNIGTTDFNMTTLKLKLGNKGFALVNPDMSPLAPAEARQITVSFLSIVPETVGDTIVFGDDCYTQQVVVIGNGGAPDFTVNGVTIGPIYVGSEMASTNRSGLVTPQGVFVRNGDAGEITIKDIQLSNTTDFYLDRSDPAYDWPFTLGSSEVYEIKVVYKALAEPGATTEVTFIPETPGVSSKVATVIGKAVAPGAEIVQNTVYDMSCVKPGDTQPYEFTIRSTGTASLTSITGVREATVNDRFTDPEVFDGAGNLITTWPKNLIRGDQWVVKTNFIPEIGKTGTYTNTIQVLGENNEVIQNGVVVATANTLYREYQLNNLPTFPIAKYLSAPITQTMEIENTTDLPIEITRIVPDLMNQGSHPNSFRIVSPATWPQMIDPGQKLTVQIEFDPSKSPDPTQTVNFMPVSTACLEKPFTVTGTISVGGITAQDYPSQELFSCASSTIPVDVTGDADITRGPLTWRIIGNNAGNFDASSLAQPVQIGANETIPVPVTFNPTPGTAAQTYQAEIEFTYIDRDGNPRVVTVPLVGLSGGIVANVASNFANAQAEAGDEVTLPITLDISKNISTLDLANANLRKVHLVYTYNTDLLSFGPGDNVANAVTGLPGGWVVDPQSAVTPTGLDLWLSGPASLTDANTTLGTIKFFVRLPEKDETDAVQLESFEIFGANGETFGQCLATSATGTSLDLVYRCGDAIYQQIMRDGKLSSIAPLTPNPVTDQKSVTFRYATRVETPITLEIIDPLGNVIDRVVDNLFHQVGAYEVRYDVSKLQSGSYIYRLLSNGSKTSQRFVVAR